MVEKLYQSTEEGQKVTRNKGVKLVAVFRRIQDPYMMTTRRESDTPKVNSSWLIMIMMDAMFRFKTLWCAMNVVWNKVFSHGGTLSTSEAEIKHICQWHQIERIHLISLPPYLLPTGLIDLTGNIPVGKMSWPQSIWNLVDIVKVQPKVFLSLIDSWGMVISLLKYFRSYITVCNSNSRFGWFI